MALSRAGNAISSPSGYFSQSCCLSVLAPPACACSTPLANTSFRGILQRRRYTARLPRRRKGSSRIPTPRLFDVTNRTNPDMLVLILFGLAIGLTGVIEVHGHPIAIHDIGTVSHSEQVGIGPIVVKVVGVVMFHAGTRVLTTVSLRDAFQGEARRREWRKNGR